MATLTSVRTAIEAKLVSNLSVAAIVAQPIGRDEAIPSGVTRASVTPAVGGVAYESNETQVLANYVIEVVHHLADPTDEDTYFDGSYATDQAALMLPSFFRTVAGVYEVTSNPTPDEVSKEGNLIIYRVTVQVSLTT